MSNTIKQIPGRCNIVACIGDDLSFQFVAKQSGSAIDMSSGYTFEAYVALNGGTTVNFAVTTSGYSSGTILITMVDSSSGTIPSGTHSWYMDRVDAGNQRRWLAGDFYAVNYKE